MVCCYDDRQASSLDGLGGVGCAVSAVGNTLVCSGVVGGRRGVLLAGELSILLIVVVDVKTKLGRVDVTVAPDEESTEDRLGEQVEDTVENGLGVRSDDVATLADTPGDRVQNPEECSQATAHEEGAADVLAQGVGVLAGLEGEDPDDEQKSDAAEGEVSPLVARTDESANETRDDHDLVNEDNVQDGRPRHASGEEQVQEQERSGDEPVNVAHVEDLTVETANHRVAALPLNHDAGPAEVRSHGEVGDGSDHGDSGGDVVEDTVLARFGGSEADEAHGRDHHDGCDRPIPVGAMGGDGNASVGVVDGIVWQTLACWLGRTRHRREEHTVDLNGLVTHGS